MKRMLLRRGLTVNAAVILGFAFVLFSCLAGGHASATDEPGSSELRGHCVYAERFAPLLSQGNHSFALCDSVVIQRNPKRALIAFRLDTWGEMVAYEGDLSGSAMTVSSVRLRSGADLAATGTCEIFTSERRISTVTCVAKAGRIYHVANFVPSRATRP